MKQTNILEDFSAIRLQAATLISKLGYNMQDLVMSIHNRPKNNDVCQPSKNRDILYATTTCTVFLRSRLATQPQSFVSS